MEEEKPNPSRFTNRRLPIPHDLWARVLKLSAASGIAYQDLVIRLLDDGLTVRTWENGKFPGRKPLPAWKPPPRPTIQTVVELDGEEVGRIELVQVPPRGETIMWRGRSHTVEERAWSLGSRSLAYLRLTPWRKS